MTQQDDGSANEYLGMLDLLYAKPAAKKPTRDHGDHAQQHVQWISDQENRRWRIHVAMWIDLWLDHLTEEDVDRVLRSANLHTVRTRSCVDASSVYDKASLRKFMQEQCITPDALVQDGFRPYLANDNVPGSNILPFRPKAPK